MATGAPLNTQDALSGSNSYMLQDKELDLKEREEAVRRMHNDAEYSRCEAEANLRSQKEESAALARKTEALSEARARQTRELDEREAALQEQARLVQLSLPLLANCRTAVPWIAQNIVSVPRRPTRIPRRSNTSPDC